jgi:hypothetical protein
MYSQPAPVPSYEGQLRPASLRQELKDFHGFHAGETFLVCGCGSSLSQVVAPERFVSIGVNDTGRLFQPDYLVVLNPRHQFRSDRFRYVEESRARTLFTHLNLGVNHPHVVRFRLGRRGGVNFDDPSVLHYTRNSPYLALCLAVHMGARRVGLIGVDFTDHHFFGQTGRHPLTAEFAQIDREYQALAASCRKLGVEVVNLSAASRLTAFPKMSPEDFARLAPLDSPEHAHAAGRKIFFVNYKFLRFGEEFSDGLGHAARDLGATHAAAYWDDPALPHKVKEFSPDLLFVVHGRKFARRWSDTFKDYNTAVWLLDEPYEVDDTSKFSRLFRTVFCNDPGTLHRHHNAHYLPVCYDPGEHSYGPVGERKYAVGFVGDYNPLREQVLELLARRGLLSYVVGGPWRSRFVNALCLSNSIPPSQTALLYRETRIVVNVFRTAHHFNRGQVPASSLNPRVYEATQCGALVVSQGRPELERVCPDLPTFDTAEEAADLVTQMLGDATAYERVRRACIRQTAEHTYAQRLSAALGITLGTQEEYRPPRTLRSFAMEITPTTTFNTVPPPLAPYSPDWDFYGCITTVGDDGTLSMTKAANAEGGTEQGLVGRVSYGDVKLSAEVYLKPDACFVAKIHQASATDQRTNSYHLLAHGARAYLARHNHPFGSFELPTGVWFSLKLVYHGGIIAAEVNGEVVCRVYEERLPQGFCFLGLKGGTVRLRDIHVAPSSREDVRGAAAPPYSVLYCGKPEAPPTVSIITTVYDRVECLANCLRSVAALQYQDYEQLVVADCPPPETLERIHRVTVEQDGARRKLLFANLNERQDDWGIGPAAAGLQLARGKYVCFLSDDNGYTPDHFEPLVAALEQDPNLGFAYSSCLYDGRLKLQSSRPRFGAIDLGQPLFRKELFDRYLEGGLPFREAAWDWRMIERLIRSGVRWRHLNRHSFIFRLAKYPHLMGTAGAPG